MQSEAKSCESSNNCAIRKASLGSLLRLKQPDVYLCPRCSRVFPTSQSLGGHQNAHRKERNAERRQILEHRKLKKFAAPILSSHPLSVAPPPTFFSPDHDHQIILPHMVDPSHGSLSSFDHKFLDFHYHVGQTFPPPPPPAFAGMKTDHGIDLNNEFINEIPCGIPLENHNLSHLYKELLPWELDMCPYSDSNEVMVEMGTPLGEVSSSSPNAIDEAESDAFVMKEKESDEIILERELDLALKL